MARILTRPKLAIGDEVSKQNLKRLLVRSKIESIVLAEKATKAVIADMIDRYTKLNQDLVSIKSLPGRFAAELDSTARSMENHLYTLVSRQFQGEEVSWEIFEELFGMRLQTKLVEVGILESESPLVIGDLSDVS